jgi:hypothetical protein
MVKMLTKSVICAFLSSLAVVCPAFAAPSGDFCPLLKQLAHEAQTNFKGIMGRRTFQYKSDGKVTDEDYAATITLPSAKCEITVDLEDRDHTAEYNCDWDYTSTLDETMREGEKLAQTVASCLGNRATARTPKGGGKEWTIPWNQEEKGVDFDVTAGQRNSKRRGIQQTLSLRVELQP